jgi:hypothetical protein
VEIQLGVFSACLLFLRLIFSEDSRESYVASPRQTHRYSTHSQDLESGEGLKEPKGEVVTHVWSESDQSIDEENWPEVDEERWQQEVDERKWP